VVTKRVPGVNDPNHALFGRRVLLRSLTSADFEDWREVRRHNTEWLTKWEPARLESHPDVIEDARSFASRCTARDRDRQLGHGASFGVFVDGVLAGEMNLGSIQRGAYQNSYVGYWIDRRHAGKGYTPEALVMVLQHAFDDLALHRVQISIIPRNSSSHRVVEKLGIRSEGVALRYLEIDGVWEDHLRYAITAEEWEERRAGLMASWVD
jgi:ribosomal-protein-alanine N-acetyltransferase